MKTFTALTATGLLALLFTTTAAAHDPDEMLMRYPAVKNEASIPKTCSELDATDKSKLNQKDPEIQALEKRCKKEASAAEKKSTQTKKSKDGPTK